MAGLGRLARGEVLEAPTAVPTTTTAGQEGEGDKMDVDDVEAKTVGGDGVKKSQQTQTQTQQTQQSTGKPGGAAGGPAGGNTGAGGGGKGKKKKGKK